MKAKHKRRDINPWVPCVVASVAIVSLLRLTLTKTSPGRPGFTLIMRSRDPVLFALGAIKHYSKCEHVGALRILQDTSISWNLTRAYLAMAKDDWQEETLGGHNNEALKVVLDDAAIPSRFIDLLDARPRGSAVLLVSDDLWIDCKDVALAFEAWNNNTYAIVGTLALGHILRPDSGQHAWLDYRVAAGQDIHGSYSMVSLDGAFVNTKYLRQAAERSLHSLRDLHQTTATIPACDEIWLNHMVTVTTKQPPIYAHANFDNYAYSDFSKRLNLYHDAMSRCLSRLASENAGKLELIWTRTAIASPMHGFDYVRSLQEERVHGVDEYPMVDNFNRRRYQLSHDRLAGVTAVLVMETRPNEVASAVRHLHARHSFICEAVVWNNNNETMNHHMFPYDVPLRYVVAPRNYSAYSRYLGCMLARHAICYFQHERTRPTFVAGLFVAFLTRPDVIVAASNPKDALIVRTNMTFFDESVGRLTGFVDVEEGAMVHKDSVRQFVQRMSLDDSRSFHERAMDADLYFAFSQPTMHMVITHTTRTNNKARQFPSVNRIGKALAFTFAFAPSSEPVTGFRDPMSRRHKHFKAPCAKLQCAFSTSIDAWPKPVFMDLGHNKTSLKPARYYANLLSSWNAIKKVTQATSLEPALNYFWAVDGDLSTTWPAQLPSKPSFMSIELLGPTIVSGVKLWCKQRFDPIPTLQLGFFGHVGYQPASCTANWTREGSLHALHYKCPPLRVHRVRLVINTYDQRLDVAEFAVERIDSKTIQAAHEFRRCDASDDTACISTPPKPADIGNVAYVLQGDPTDYCSGEKLAMLEEACELGALYPGKVKLIYVGTTPKTSLQSFARIFEVLGSRCAFDKSLKFEAVPVQSDVQGDELGTDEGIAPGTDQEVPSTHHALSRRMIELHEWWLKRKLDARVVLFDPHESPLLFVLRDNQAASNTIFVARSAKFYDDVEESTALAHATTVSSKADYVLQAQGPADWVQDRRIVYPLRTLAKRPPLLETPTIPAVEEVVVLVTLATTPDDMDLFNAHALPILQQRADVRLANITALQHAMTSPNTHDEMENPDSHVKSPKWRTLRDVVYYVAIYPARVLWVMDASIGSAYYASFASVGAARFVAASAAIPHWESQILAWNASCDWTPEGFAGKARELLQGRFDLSSSFKDRDRLRHDAHNVIVEEWPIKRYMAPFANTVAEISMYLAELESVRHLRDTTSFLVDK